MLAPRSRHPRRGRRGRRGPRLKHDDSQPVPTDSPAPAGEQILGLVRRGTEADRELLRGYTPEQLAGAVVQLAPRQRCEALIEMERVQHIVPLLPAAEFTSTVRAEGIEDAGWLVEYASAEQRVAAVDLDCWKDLRLSPRRLFEWIDAMIEAGTETLVAAFDELDPELWVLAMKAMADFSFADGSESGGATADGFVFYDAQSSEDEERIFTILSTALTDSPHHYWSFVSGAILDSQQECEELAARWQRGRLNDLGFPDRDHAMRAYRPLRPDAVPAPPVELGTPPTHALVASFQPPEQLAGSLVGQALSELAPHRATELLGHVLGVANTLAVADQLPLGDSETIGASLRKALRGIERGLVELARNREESLARVLDAVPAHDLFRVGVALDPALRPRRSLSDLETEEDRDDWNLETESLDWEDQTLGPDGSLRK